MGNCVMEIRLEGLDILEATVELLALWGDGAGVPNHVRDRMQRALDTDNLVDIDGATFRPSPELLSIIATLRAARG